MNTKVRQDRLDVSSIVIVLGSVEKVSATPFAGAVAVSAPNAVGAITAPVF
jgi:hypothetical protein